MFKVEADFKKKSLRKLNDFLSLLFDVDKFSPSAFSDVSAEQAQRVHAQRPQAQWSRLLSRHVVSPSKHRRLDVLIQSITVLHLWNVVAELIVVLHCPSESVALVETVGRLHFMINRPRRRRRD